MTGSRSGLGTVAGIVVMPMIAFTLPVFITIFVRYLPLSGESDLQIH
jgi:hypothetical protein